MGSVETTVMRTGVMMEEEEDPIVIVGVAFKMPGEIVDETSFWDVLEKRKNLMTTWPESRINVDAFHATGRSDNLNKITGRGAYFINEDPAAFDASFFSISVAEATAMDPRQRWGLEVSYHAFENAGIPLEKLKGSQTAVFGASFSDDYARMQAKDPDTAPRYGATGTSSSILPNRVSWFFNLRGPSVHVDTACSTGLVALDMACQSLRSGDSEAALVLGTSLHLSPDNTALLSNMSFLSPDSKCYTFDSRANGFARGEGIVALVVKPLSAALRDGDVVRAVVRGTATNQDGRTRGITQPDPEAQETLIRLVYAKAGLDSGAELARTRYFEAHGTGTAIGDPIEVEAIGKAFAGVSRSAEEPLYIGSVKSNIGHLEAASGLAAVIKSILMLEKGLVPPQALFENLNPDIKLPPGVIIPNKACVPWPTRGLRRISVNSFGFGGTNSHAVLDDALHYLRDRGLEGFNNGVEVPTTAARLELGCSVNGSDNDTTGGAGLDSHQTMPRLLVWTAADQAAVNRMTEGYQQYYQDHVVGKEEDSSSTKVDRLSFTLAARRTMMPWRTFAVVDDTFTTTTTNDVNVNGHNIPLLQASKPVRAADTQKLNMAFVFTGQGAQYAEMGQDLLRYPVFRESVERSDRILAALDCGWSVADMMQDGSSGGGGGAINEPEVSQTLCTALQLALVDLLRSFSVVPSAVVGHSSGEIAAAYAIGALSHAAALKVAFYRGRVARRLNVVSPERGAMLSTNIAASEVPAYLSRLLPGGDSEVKTACINSPANVTLSGPEAAIMALKAGLDAEGIFAHKLETGGIAYHSSAMALVTDEYLELLGGDDSTLEAGSAASRKGWNAGSINMVSSVTGKMVDAAKLTSPRYWVDNLVSPVRFADALSACVGICAATDVVEIGPHAALKSPISDTLADALPTTVPTTAVPRYHSSLYRNKSALTTMLHLVGALFCHGHDSAVSAVLSANGHHHHERIKPLTDLPPYPFDHSRRYWAESRFSRDYRLRPASLQGYNRLLGVRSHDFSPLTPRWRNWLSAESKPWLGHHVVNNNALLPGTGMLVMALEAAAASSCSSIHAVSQISGFAIKDAHLLASIPIPDTSSAQDDRRVETVVELRPIVPANTHEKSMEKWSEVRIFSYTYGGGTAGNTTAAAAANSGTWKECFRANVQVLFTNGSSSSTPAWLAVDEQKEDRKRLKRTIDAAEDRCTQDVETARFYSFCEKELGLGYGEAFQLLDGIRWGGDGGTNQSESVARIDMSITRQTLSRLAGDDDQGDSANDDHGNDGLVHPAVLDAMLHLFMAHASKGLAEMIPTLVPQRIGRAWISAKSCDSTRSVRVCAAGSRGDKANILAVGDDGTPLCSIENLAMAEVSRPQQSKNTLHGKDAGADVELNRTLLHNIVWKPQLSSLNPKELGEAVCREDNDAVNAVDEAMMVFFPKLEKTLRVAARKALQELAPEDLIGAPGYLSKYVASLQHYFGQGEEDVDLQNNPEVFENMLRDCEEAQPAWRLFPAIARALPSIIRGESSLLDILFGSGNAASDFYASIFGRICSSPRLAN